MVHNAKVDFTAYRALALQRTWTIQELVNGVLQDYNLVGKTIIFRAYDRSDVPGVLYELNPIVQSDTGRLTFDFSSVNTDYEELVDYLIIEDPLGAAITIQNGTISFVPIGTSFPFYDLVLNETPAGLVIPENYITIKAFEWRLYLQNAITPNISDADVSNEAAWPVLVNYLIAKLVVYDYLVKALKGLIAQNDANDPTNSAGVKKIETGPSNVEFFDNTKSLAAFLQLDRNGNSPLTSLAEGICQLARRLRIFLPMCKNMNTDPLIPERTCSPSNPDQITILTKYFS